MYYLYNSLVHFSYLDPCRVEEVVEGESLLGVDGEQPAHQLLGRRAHVPPRAQVMLDEMKRGLSSTIPDGAT